MYNIYIYIYMYMMYIYIYISIYIYIMYIYICMYLVGGFNHLETYESQWEGLSRILWKIRNV